MKCMSLRAGWIGTLLVAGVLVAAPVGAAHHRPKSAPPPAIPLDEIHVLGDRPAPFALDARSAMMIEAHSGEVLYAYHEHERIQPASLAKLMTFYITLDALRAGRLSLDTPVTISEKAWRLSIDPTVSKMFLAVGQRVPVRELLYGLMVSSGNDAAVALAEYEAGSTDAFVGLMNQYVAKLGLSETHFMSPDGLPEPDQYTTAADMVKLASLLLQRFPDALTYTSPKEFTFDNITQRNWNTLLLYDSRVDGLKTGHVSEAGFHLVATAHQGDMRLISALLGTPNAEKRRTETEKLIDWAFRTYVNYQPNPAGLAPSSLPVYEGRQPAVAITPAHEVVITLPRGEDRGLALAANLPASYLIAPVAAAATVGTITVSKGSTTLLQIPLETRAAVARAGSFGVLWGKIALFFHRLGHLIKAALWASVSWLPFVRK
ncbi:MAG TPA: D-alanyl-D-alanine carboxypeptidase family protein [Candidatus Binataceae bacterium]|nr:D-alanyl-D-alanine carboxypeptidase family protein [Candidatus Binataceae bacterium]